MQNRYTPRVYEYHRRNKLRNRRAFADFKTRDVTAENIVVPMVNMMMTGVTRSGDGANFERRHSHDFIVLQNFDALGRNGRDFPPKPFHVVAENAHGRLDQFCGIEQVRRAAWMHVNRCSFRETPGGAGMVEMNVTQKNMAHVFRVRPGLSERSSHVTEGRFRAGSEQFDPVLQIAPGRG